jgi:hypothetical protein
MFMAMSYEVLRTRYPNEVIAIETAIRLSRAKAKNDPFESFNWGFNWGVRIDGGTFSGFLSGKPEEAVQSLDERVADYGRRCLVTLTASKGRGRWYSGMIEAPTELLEAQRKSLLQYTTRRAGKLHRKIALLGFQMHR